MLAHARAAGESFAGGPARRTAERNAGKTSAPP